MNFDFLSSENLFQKTLIAPEQGRGSSSDRHAFSTRESSASDNDEKFVQFLAKSKASQNDKKPQNSSEKSESAAQPANSDIRKRFTTREATHHTLGELPDDNILADQNLNLSNIALLQQEIQQLIAAHENGTGEAVPEPLTVEGSELGDDRDNRSLLSLLASFLQTGNEEDQEHNANSTHGDSLADLLGQIQKAVENGDIPSLTSGLTIEQLSALDENLDAYIHGQLSDEEQDVLETLASQWVTLITPREQANAKNSTIERQSSDIVSTTLKPVQQQYTPAPDTRHHSQSRYDGRYDANIRGSDAPVQDGSGQDITFKNDLAQAGKAGHTPSQAPTTESAAQRFLQNSGMLYPASGGDAATPALTYSTSTSAQGQVQNSLTSVVTQSQNATQPHPATQVVSATIQKAVKAGEETNIKLRLDPAELGRVEVKMSIDKDNTARIVLTAEKPETFMMLQKDSDVLQRALAESGLDTQGELSFELASDNHDFGRGNNHSQHGNNSGAQGDVQEETLETTMDWHVDPATGHMHYSILV